MGSYNYQVLGWPAQPRSKKRREANITSGGGTISSGGGADVDLSGYIRIADLIKTTSDASVSEFLDTNAMSSLMVKTLLDQKANTIHDHSSQLIRPAVMVIPQIDPSDAGFSLASGEVAEFISHDGSFAEPSGSVTPADLKDLTLKINGVTVTTYNPASAASFNVDLTDYATQSWVEAKNYLQGITKAMVEAVLTGNITSHTHSQYLTSHQSLADYYTKSEVDTKAAKTAAWADSKLLYNGQTIDTDIANFGISASTNRLNTSGVYVAVRANSSNPFIGLNQGGNLWYAQAASGYFYFGPTSTKALRLDQSGNGVFQTGSVTATSFIKSGGTSSQFLKADGSVDSNTYLTSHQSLANYYTKTQADAKFLTEHQSLEDYALKSEIPTSMAWSAITGRPSKLSDFTNDLISTWALASSKPSYTWSEIGSRPTKLSQFTNDIISSWALAATKPDYTWSEILNKPTTLSGFGITDGYSSFSTTGSGNAITDVSGSGHALTFTKGNTFVDLASEQTISGKKHISYLDVTGAFAVPQVEPSAEAGKVFEYISSSGSFGESASAVTPADLKDLVLKVNGVTVTTYNPASAASFNVDLADYATQSWVEAKNYLQGITKAMVEAVLTGNITSHTHSQYLTSHQSLANYYTKTQADAKFLTEHQSLEDYALKSEIPTSMAWSAITGRPSKLSDFTNDLISSWALAATKPSYSWSEIGSRPTTLADFTDDSTHRLVTDTQITNWNAAYGWGNHADAGYLTSFTETDPTVPAWAKATSKPSYTWSEIGSRPTKLSQFTNDIISSWALAASKPSYTLDEVTDGSSRKLSNYVSKAGDTMTGALVTPMLRAANTYYGISFDRTTATPVETILYTGIKWASSRHMPVLHITGYAYGLQSPVEFKIGFYIYGGKIGYCGVTNMGSWAPDVYLFKYTNSDTIDCVAVGLSGSCYFLQLQADVQDELGKFANILVDRSKWSWSFKTSTGTIPEADGGTTCIKVPYKADILSVAWSKVTGKPTTLSGFGITDGYSSFSTTGSGNAITGVSGSGHALTFTKGNTFVDLASEQTISGKKHISHLDVTASLAVPQVEPTAESGKVFEYISSSGGFGESASAVTPADLKDLVLKVNGVTVTTYNPASAASFNVDLTDYATQSWVEAKNYLQGITKAQVEAVLTGNITSHTHSQYLTSHQSLANYYTKTQADAKFLTEHQSLEDYALKSEIPTSMAWSAITGRPSKLSDFTNDLISSWALAATKPSYSWSEIGSKPTSLSGYGISDATSKTEAIPYIVGPSTDTTAGTWTGTYEGITAYTDGLTIIYVPAVAGASTTTLNINGLGAKTCYFSNTSKLTTHYSAGTPILFTYRGGYWRRADYNTNSDTLLRVYRQTSGYNDDYPILVSRTKSIGTAGSNSSYTAVYGVVYDTTQQPTVNPYSGEFKALKVTATTLQGSLAWSYINGKPTSLSDFTNDMISSWALAASKPAYTLDEVTDGSSRKLSDYMLSSAFTKSAITTLLGNNTYAAYNANGYLPLNGGTLTGGLTIQANQTFNAQSATRSIYYTDSSNNSLRAIMLNTNGNLSIGYDGPSKGKSTYLDGTSVYFRFGASKNYTLTLSGDDGTLRSSTGANMLSIGYRSGNTIYPFKNIYSTFHIATKCLGATNGTVLYGVASFTIANTKKARTFAIKIPSSMGAYVTFKIVMYSPYNYCPASTITVNAGAFNLTSGNYCALYPSYSVEGSFAGRVAFARDGDTSSSNMYILLGSYGDGQQYQSGMIAIDSIIHSDTVANADTIMNFGYTLLDLDDETMFTKITECANADAHFKSVTVTDSVTAPKVDCTSMLLVPTGEPSSVPTGKVAEYIDLTSGSFAN